jgi:hypothetical protein
VGISAQGIAFILQVQPKIDPYTSSWITPDLEPVLKEAAHLLRQVADAQDALLGLLASGALRVAFKSRI